MTFFRCVYAADAHICVYYSSNQLNKISSRFGFHLIKTGILLLVYYIHWIERIEKNDYNQSREKQLRRLNIQQSHFQDFAIQLKPFIEQAMTLKCFMWRGHFTVKAEWRFRTVDFFSDDLIQTFEKFGRKKWNFLPNKTIKFLLNSDNVRWQNVKIQFYTTWI